jgi:HK97 family phage prohead protease
MSDRFDHTRAFHVAEFKALGGVKGEFEALVSVFGNVDLGGDRIIPGAFTKSLAQWQERGDPIPIIWNHMWDNPEAHIGEADPGDVVETDDGLLVKRGRIDLDRPFAEQVFHLLERRRVKEFSFGYNLRDAEKGKDGALNLLDIDLFEVGPTLKGMNPDTELLAVKALAAVTDPEPESLPTAFPLPRTAHRLEFKAGARHSKETLAALTRIRADIDALIGTGTDAETEPSKSDEAEPTGKASTPDVDDLMTRIRLLEGK